MSLPSNVYKRMPKRLPRSLGFSRYCLDFLAAEAEDYVDCGNDPSLNIGAGGTVIFWFKARALQPVSWPNLLSFWVTTNDKIVFFLHRDTRHLMVTFAEGGATLDTLDSGVAVNDDKWHVMACPFDASGGELYLDLVIRDSTPVDVTVAFPDNPTLYLGNNAPWLGNWYNGLLDELLVYNTRLDWSSIEYIIHNYHNPIRNGLVLFLRMEEGAGLTAYDQSGYGNHGTLNPASSPPVWTKNGKWELRAEAGL